MYEMETTYHHFITIPDSTMMDDMEHDEMISDGRKRFLYGKRSFDKSESEIIRKKRRILDVSVVKKSYNDFNAIQVGRRPSVKSSFTDYQIPTYSYFHERQY